MQSVEMQTASVSIAVLTIDGRNLKKSFIDQLPEADFEDVFTLREEIGFDKGCTPWGWVRTIDSDVLLTEIKGVLHGNVFSENVVNRQTCEEAHYLQWLYGEGSIFFDFGDQRFEFRDGLGMAQSLNAQGKEDCDSYIKLIRSLPQLFLV